ncbi:MAG: DUF3472 domain-containing protein, partial [Gemmataceae bacterium]
LKGIACRSVHLGYPAAEGVAFYNEIAVDRSAPGTYFMVCGLDKGYFGMQELGNGKKLLLFSVWDSGQNDPKAVAADKRVQLLHKDAKVRIGRFGGEGTGGQSFFDYDWKVGHKYRFLVTAKADGKRTAYAGWFYVPEDKAWKHLVTFSTLTAGKPLRGYYSFIEDFKRDRVSATKVRSAHFGNGWIQSKDGEWKALTKARFTADRNPVTNINAALDGERFLLATGGDTKNKDVKLRATLDLPPRDKRMPPEKLPIPAAKKDKTPSRSHAPRGNESERSLAKTRRSLTTQLSCAMVS